MDRRKFVGTLAGAPLSARWLGSQGSLGRGPGQATGVRVGEVTPTTAVIWTRLTLHSTRYREGVVIPGRMDDYKGRDLPRPTVPVDQLEGVCPATSGQVRLRYGLDAKLRHTGTTEWVSVRAEDDGICHFRLEGLRPDSLYYFTSESRTPRGSGRGAEVQGQFRTAPLANQVSQVRFCVMSCQGYPDRGHVDGHDIYPAMQSLNPAFACLTGDLVYYDNDMPRANDARLARYHWERMFSLPRLIDFNRRHATYWLKDDHDTLSNDAWPGMTMGQLTFAEGQQIFREQAPLGKGPGYRTFRWGRDLQIWLSEGRDHRSPNRLPDSATKTIWGVEQIEWFKRTVLESNATWKVLVSPTPLVGPDRPSGKSDNHSNVDFRSEGEALRGWIRANAPENLIVICGDRHWQYHSVHPETGLHEFSVGAASNEHAGGTPGENPQYHRFHRVAGGFLSVEVSRVGGRPQLISRHHDTQGRVVYESVR
ncbi:MAG: alkaline phosphatase D family protein [Acidobacteriota bacterium]